METDYNVCPYCNDDEDVITSSDGLLWQFGWIEKYCEKCNRCYKVHFKMVATRIETD